MLDANARAGIAFIRSLGRAGLHVVAGECRPGAAGFYSRFCAGRIVYRSPFVDRRGFVEDILEELRRNPYQALFAITDQTLLPLAASRAEVLSLVSSPLPVVSGIRGAFDKGRTLEIARSLGIHVPRTIELASLAEAERRASEIGYPVVVKTRRSTTWAGGSGSKRKPLYAFGPGELLRQIQTLSSGDTLPLLQEFIPGPERGFATLVVQGREIGNFELERVRSTHPLGSGSWCCSRAVAHDPYISQASRKLIEALQWEGFALLEFKIDERNGRPYLLEMNGRPWASLHLAIKAGVDFPLLAYRALCEGRVEMLPESYRVGTECRWLRGDLMYLRHVLGGTPAGSPIQYPGRMRGLVDCLGVSGGEEFMFADLGPGAVALGRHFAAGLRRVAARVPLGRSKARSRDRYSTLGRVAMAIWLAWMVAVYGRYLFGYRQLIGRGLGLLGG